MEWTIIPMLISILCAWGWGYFTGVRYTKKNIVEGLEYRIIQYQRRCNKGDDARQEALKLFLEDIKE